MTTIECIDSTGDREVNINHKSEPSFSRAIAKEIVNEILENALDRVAESAEKSPVGDIFGSQITGKSIGSNSKIKLAEDTVCPLKGIGDQVSNLEILSTGKKHHKHPLVEKKNRLTDLVKNSKQILARYIQSKTDMTAADVNATKEEKLVKVIELDCVHVEDLPFRSYQTVSPENIPLPREDSSEIIRDTDEGKMDEIRLGATNSEPGPSKEDLCKKTMTFPMSAAGPNKSSFAAKCRTLRLNAGDFKKKRWSFGAKIANFLRKRHSKGHVEKNDEKDKDESIEDEEKVPDNEKDIVKLKTN